MITESDLFFYLLEREYCICKIQADTNFNLRLDSSFYFEVFYEGSKLLISRLLSNLGQNVGLATLVEASSDYLSSPNLSKIQRVAKSLEGLNPTKLNNHYYQIITPLIANFGKPFSLVYAAGNATFITRNEEYLLSTYSLGAKYVEL